MKGKSETMSLVQPLVEGIRLGRMRPSGLAMGLALVLLAAATAGLVVAVVGMQRPAGIEAGLEASSARWSGLGAHSATPDYAAIAGVSSARWSALGAHYGAEASAEKFVRTVWAAEKAFQAGDVDQLIEFYASDAVSLPPGFPASVGKEAIEADLRWFFGEFDLVRDFTLADYEVAGHYATRLGEWTQTLTPKSGGDPIVETGRCILGFEKMRGEWRIVWEIWNTYEPPSE